MELKNYLSYLFKQGRQDLAIPFIEELVRENPDHPNLRQILEDLTQQAGRNPIDGVG
jgi:hypothetical protein